MTTFPKPLKDRMASTIRSAVALAKVHAQKISQLESSNAANQATIASQATTITIQGGTITSQGTTITTLASEISTLQSQVTTLQNLTAALSPSQVTFLAGLGQMTQPGAYPLSDDSNSGSTWVAGERSYVNSSIDMCNTLIGKLMNEGYMS